MNLNIFLPAIFMIGVITLLLYVMNRKPKQTHLTLEQEQATKEYISPEMEWQYKKLKLSKAALLLVESLERADGDWVIEQRPAMDDNAWFHAYRAESEKAQLNIWVEQAFVSGVDWMNHYEKIVLKEAVDRGYNVAQQRSIERERLRVLKLFEEKQDD